MFTEEKQYDLMFKAYMFLCTNKTEDECFKHMLFSTDTVYAEMVTRVRKGDYLFLLNLEKDVLYGVFRAKSDGGKNLISVARNGKYPYQVEIEPEGEIKSVSQAKMLLSKMRINWKELLSKNQDILLLNFVQNRFIKEIIETYSKESQKFEEPQDQSKYKRTDSMIKEVESTNSVENIDVKISHNDELFYHADSIWVYNADILKTNSIKDKSIDLIVTSPPYNVDIKYNSHDDTMSYDDYLSFTREWLARCYNFLKDDGRFCLNIPLDKNKGGQQSTYADITTIAKQVGYKYHSTIIWNEQNISKRTAWGSWLSATAPYVIAPVEVIVVLYKKKWKKTSGSRKSDITKNEFVEWTNGVWSFSGESKKRVGHPAPFPVELPRRCIKLFSFVGDTILDPFLGSGTTLLACLRTGRSGIGVDIDKKYCELAKKRLLKEGHINQLKLHDVEGA